MTTSRQAPPSAATGRGEPRAQEPPVHFGPDVNYLGNMRQQTSHLHGREREEMVAWLREQVLQNRRQRPGESVDAYTTDLSRSCALANRGKTLLYVVNHLSNYSTSIEKFVYEENGPSLLHTKTWLDTHIRYVNDVVAVDEDEFYYTNNFYYPSTGNFEMLLGLQWQSIGYCLHDDCHLVTEKLFMPNGINTSPDGKYIYSMSNFPSTMLVFSRSTHGSLVLVQEYPLEMVVDNIDVDRETGDLWCGAHPKGHKLMAYLDDPKTTSPSQVLKFKTRDGLISGVSQVYSNDGTEISASSVAVRHGDAMLVGAVATPPIYCSLEYVTP